MPSMTMGERVEALWYLRQLHALIAEDKDESEEADKIRDSLESLMRTPSDKAMLQWMSEQLYHIKEHRNKKANGITMNEELIQGLLMTVCEAIHTDPKYPASIYGDDYENNTFKMHRYCWCEMETCPYCEEDAPNFIHHKSGLKIWWHKYIGRGMRLEAPEKLNSLQILETFQDVIRSINLDHNPS